MVLIDFSKLYMSDYADYIDDDDETKVLKLLENAPSEIKELYNSYRKIINEEKRTGMHII